jgi:hypothetical protein
MAAVHTYLLATVHTCSNKYPVGAELPDCRSAVAVDRLAKVRKFGDSLQAQWRRVYRVGTVLTVDETMIA